LPVGTAAGDDPAGHVHAVPLHRHGEHLRGRQRRELVRRRVHARHRPVLGSRDRPAWASVDEPEAQPFTGAADFPARPETRKIARIATAMKAQLKIPASPLSASAPAFAPCVSMPPVARMVVGSVAACRRIAGTMLPVTRIERYIMVPNPNPNPNA